MQNPTTLELRRPNSYCIEVWLNRPDVRNAFNETVIAELAQVFQDIARNDQLRVVVLAAHGKAFCAGADLNWMQAKTVPTPNNWQTCCGPWTNVLCLSSAVCKATVMQAVWA
jgi:enoyl-CoA hydratase/carnithine racemase